MKKKITALVLAVIMCLSFIISARAADTLKRVPSTIPGTDKKYNYVENVTVKIPGTNVTYELTDVYEKVGLVYESGIPVYRFAFLEQDKGEVVLKQDGEYAVMGSQYIGYTELQNGHSAYDTGDGAPEQFKSNDIFNYTRQPEYIDYDSHNVSVVMEKSTCIRDDGSCSVTDNDNTILAKVEFYWGTGCKCDNGYEYPYDLISFENDSNGSYYDTLLERDVPKYFVPKDIEKIDISLLDVNYKPSKEYKITDGANSVVNSDAKSLKIKADGEFSKLTGVKVDGKTVDSSNYTASEGSTIIELHGEYLKTLKEGNHSVTVVFTDGEATTQFEIKKDKNTGTANKTDKPAKPDVEIPNTDMDSSVTAIFAVMALSGTAVIVFKKKKYTL